jgi:DNA modification methylase
VKEVAQLTQKREKTDLDGKTWARYSISVWSDIEKDIEEKRLKHPALFPKSLAGRLIEIFTKPNDLVLDIFAGSGSTLAAAYSLGRRSAGFEISAEFVELAKSRLHQTNLDSATTASHEPLLINEDAAQLSDYIQDETVALCVTSPPYWNILDQKRTADFRETQNYGELPKDLSKIQDYHYFIKALGDIFVPVYRSLKKNGYLVVNVMDIRKGPVFYPLHIDLCLELTGRGFTLDDMIIWDRRKEYNSLRPLGYPYVFRVNKVHEFLLIFQKRS